MYSFEIRNQRRNFSAFRWSERELIGRLTEEGKKEIGIKKLVLSTPECKERYRSNFKHEERQEIPMEKREIAKVTPNYIHTYLVDRRELLPRTEQDREDDAARRDSKNDRETPSFSITTRGFGEEK